MDVGGLSSFTLLVTDLGCFSRTLFRLWQEQPRIIGTAMGFKFRAGHLVPITVTVPCRRLAARPFSARRRFSNSAPIMEFLVGKVTLTMKVQARQKIAAASLNLDDDTVSIYTPVELDTEPPLGHPYHPHLPQKRESC